MVKQVKSEKIESILDYNKYIIDDDGSGFVIRTNFEEENEKQANDFFEQNYSFKNLDGGQKLEKIAPIKETNAEKKKRLEEKGNTLDKWYGLSKKTQLSQDEKNQLVLLKLKDYLNPKQHFRTTDMKKIPKFFQIATVIDGKDDGFAVSKIPRGLRKANLAQELLELDKQVQFTKKKFGQIQEVKQRIAKNSDKNKRLQRARKHMKHLKKHKK
ncbi:hypothetical protein ABPG72_007504 [Tetrahymena utriculariae]